MVVKQNEKERGKAFCNSVMTFLKGFFEETRKSKEPQVVFIKRQGVLEDRVLEIPVIEERDESKEGIDEQNRRRISGLCGYLAIAAISPILKENRDKEATQRLIYLVRFFANNYKYLDPKARENVNLNLVLILSKEKPTEEGEELVKQVLITIFLNDIRELSEAMLKLKEDIENGERRFSDEVKSVVYYLIRTFEMFPSSKDKELKKREEKAMEKLVEMVELIRKLKSEGNEWQKDAYRGYLIDELEILRYLYKDVKNSITGYKIEGFIRQLVDLNDHQINSAVIDFINWSRAYNLSNVLEEIAKRDEICGKRALVVLEYFKRDEREREAIENERRNSGN
jgi:hypothetical protein